MSPHLPRLFLVFIQSAIGALAITALIVFSLVEAGGKPGIAAAVALPVVLLLLALFWRWERRSHQGQEHKP